MVNIVVYLPEECNAIELVELLLDSKLVAAATIDENNVTYSLREGQLITTVNKVITAQTKSMLFRQVDEIVQMRVGQWVPVYSVPITQANVHFDRIIRENTQKT